MYSNTYKTAVLNSTCILLPDKTLTLMLCLHLALPVWVTRGVSRERGGQDPSALDRGFCLSDFRRSRAPFSLILFVHQPQARARHTIGSDLPGSVFVAPKMSAWTLGALVAMPQSLGRAPRLVREQACFISKCQRLLWGWKGCVEGLLASARITALILSTVTASPGGEPPTSTAMQEEMGCHHLGAGGGRSWTLSQICWRGKAAVPPQKRPQWPGWSRAWAGRWSCGSQVAVRPRVVLRETMGFAPHACLCLSGDFLCQESWGHKCQWAG